MIEGKYEDGARPFFAGVVDRIKAYDPRLFFRWNLEEEVWELWRWRDGVEVPSRPTPAMRTERAVLQFQIGKDAVTHRFFRSMVNADMTRMSETLDPEIIHQRMLAEERRQWAEDDKMIEEEAQAWASDNAKQLREWVQDKYAGYYPSELNP